MITLSEYQEVFLIQHIRKEVARLSKLVVSYRADGLDTSRLRDYIFEMKTLYRQLLGVPYPD